MKIKVTKNPFEEWERIEFPAFPQGTEVVVGSESEHEGWFEAKIQGRETYVPGQFITDQHLNRDYNPTELAVEIGDTVTIKETHHGWFLAEDARGVKGWVLADYTDWSADS